MIKVTMGYETGEEVEFTARDVDDLRRKLKELAEKRAEEF